MFIDPHVHCRDGKQAYKETIAHALSVAERGGFTAIFDMPNTDPPVTRREHVIERLSLAHEVDSNVFYGIHIALTADKEQIKEAVDTYNNFQEVIGFKLYAGHSVGNVGVIEEESQQQVYYALKEFGYKGIVVLHCEKDSLLKPELWDPNNPITHAYARSPEAEIESVRDQINFSIDAKFNGIVHIAHISVPEAVDVVQRAKNKIKITCGVTPHHLIFNLHKMEEPNGLLYKINPPLRSESMRITMLEYLDKGKIDWVETDHAPHTLEEKLNIPYMSGIPGLQFYPKFITWLQKTLGFTSQKIQNITFNNIKRAYNINLQPRQTKLYVQAINELGKEYQFDPFKDFSTS